MFIACITYNIWAIYGIPAYTGFVVCNEFDDGESGIDNDSSGLLLLSSVLWSSLLLSQPPSLVECQRSVDTRCACVVVVAEDGSFAVTFGCVELLYRVDRPFGDD